MSHCTYESKIQSSRGQPANVIFVGKPPLSRCPSPKTRLSHVNKQFLVRLRAISCWRRFLPPAKAQLNDTELTGAERNVAKIPSKASALRAHPLRGVFLTIIRPKLRHRFAWGACGVPGVKWCAVRPNAVCCATK